MDPRRGRSRTRPAADVRHAPRPHPAVHRRPGRRPLGRRPAERRRPLADRPGRAPGRLRPSSAGGERSRRSGIDGRALALSARRLWPKGASSTRRSPGPAVSGSRPERFARVEGDGWTAVVPAHSGEQAARPAAARADSRKSAFPRPVGARPIAWGRELLVPGDDGRAYLIDPLTGRVSRRAVRPAVRPDPANGWRTPVVARRATPSRWPTTPGASAASRGSTDPRPRLVVAAETTLGQGPRGRSRLDRRGGRRRDVRRPRPRALGPRPQPGRRLVARRPARRFRPATVWRPRATWPTRPAACSPSAPDGQRLWSATLGEKAGSVEVVGPPAVRGQAVWFLARDGTLHARSLADGSSVATIPLDILPAGGPVAVGNDLAIPVGLGAIRLLTIEAGAVPSKEKP